MSVKTIKFEIATPRQVIFKDYVVRATIPTEAGEVTILPDHIPLVSIMKPGVIEVEKPDGVLDIMAVAGGFLEVMKDKIVILADYAQRAVDLDEKVIEEARLRAEKAKQDAKNKDAVDFANISARLEVELTKSRALSRWRRIKNTGK
jgi:F-type H+-transporting ATPase subunit epsilon